MRLVANILLPLALLAGAGFGASRLVLSAETTEREPQRAAAPLVRVAEIIAYDGAARIHGSGIVEAAREVTLSPEVTGPVTFRSPVLVEGGRVLKGEKLIGIDGRAYALAVKQSRAQVEVARADLELEDNASSAAQLEWAAVGQMPGKDARRVAFKEPQVDAAAARVRSAKGALDKARLDLGKTTLVAPFDATVRQESVEIGQVVGPGTVLATLVATDQVWARLSLPVEALSLIEFPEGETAGSAVTVVQGLSSGKTVVRSGTVLRLLSALDAQSRTAQVIVGIDHPLDPAPGELPLLTGAFVDAEIDGLVLQGARVVPRDAVFEGNRVWVVDSDGRLHPRTVTVAFSDDTRLIVTDGVELGEQVVMTALRTPTQGMQVRTESAPPAVAD